MRGEYRELRELYDYQMSRTRKDSRQGTVIELIEREDGTFDLFLNRELNHVTGDN